MSLYVAVGANGSPIGSSTDPAVAAGLLVSAGLTIRSFQYSHSPGVAVTVDASGATVAQDDLVYFITGRSAPVS